MVAELKQMGVEVMVSIWPTVNPNADNYSKMHEEGWLIEASRGMSVFKPFIDTDTGPLYKVSSIDPWFDVKAENLVRRWVRLGLRSLELMVDP